VKSVVAIDDDSLAHGPLLCHLLGDAVRQLQALDQFQATANERGRGKREERSHVLVQEKRLPSEGAVLLSSGINVWGGEVAPPLSEEEKEGAVLTTE
jgi:hypothetical protein